MCSPVLISVKPMNAPMIEPRLLCCVTLPNRRPRWSSDATSAVIAFAASQTKEDATPWMMRAATMPHT